MLTERKVVLGCMVALGLWAETVSAKPVEVIRPEDEAILEGVFDIDGENARQDRPSPMADGNGVVMKGARDASRIRAVPLNVTFGEKTSGQGDNSSEVSDKASNVSDKTSEPAVKISSDADKAQEMTLDVNSGTNLKDTMKNVVEGTPKEQVGEKKVEAVVQAETVSKIVENSESAEKEAKDSASDRYQDEIGYTYPSKSEREQARQPLKEWYNPESKAADTYKTETKNVPQDETFMQYRLAIADCLDTRQDDLEMDKAMLKQGNMYDATAYLSQTLEEVNLCYENIGYDIIRDYYGDEPQVKARFANDARDFYITGSDVNFSPKFCGEDCSVEAMVDAQLAKFADFRTYLAKLLNERPTQAPVLNQVENVQNVQYDDVPFIDEYLEEDAQGRTNSVPPAYETYPLSSRPQPNYNTRPATRPVSDGQGNRYELPEIL